MPLFVLDGNNMRLKNSVTVTVASITVLCDSFVLPPPTGIFNVGSEAFVLPKLTTDDPVAPNGTGTFILLNVYYPTEQKASPSKYIWSNLSNLYDNLYGLPNGTFRNTTALVSYKAKPLPLRTWKKLQLPTLIFNPGFAGPPSRLFHALLSDLASHGYSVLALDHPHEAPYIQLPDGTGISGLPFGYQTDTKEKLKLV